MENSKNIITMISLVNQNSLNIVIKKIYWLNQSLYTATASAFPLSLLKNSLNWVGMYSYINNIS